MFNIQISSYDELFKIRERQSLKSKVIKAERGRIFDTDGILLSDTVPSLSIFVDPSMPIFVDADTSHDKDIVIRLLNEVTGLEESQIRKKLDSKRKFVWIKRQVNIELEKVVKQIGVDGIGTMLEDKRSYPQKDSACHVLGFAGVDTQGLTGLELFYDEVLKGKDGLETFHKDALGRKISSKKVYRNKAVNGKDLHLALNINMQKIVDNELKRYAYKYGIIEGAIIIMKADTGEILALSNFPTFDPNNYQNYSPKIYNKNISIQEAFDSKPIVFLMMAATGIERRNLNKNTNLFGKVKISDYFFRPSNIDSNFLVDFGQYIGEEALLKYFKSFGVGEKTGIDLPGESEGEFELSKFLVEGQGIKLTPIQCVKIMATIINDGISMIPVIVLSEFLDESIREAGHLYNKVTLKGVSNVLKRFLVKTVTFGESKDISIEGYVVGGIGSKIMGADSPGQDRDIFTGFLTDDSLKIKFAMFVMVKTLSDDKSKRSSNIGRLLFRTIAFEMLRYLESRKIQVQEKTVLHN